MIQRTTLFCLHFLGGSGRAWSAVAGSLSGFAVVPIDLPGFGDAADVPGYGVSAMVEHVTAAIGRHGGGRFVLAGHSMGAKVVLGLARRAEDGDPGLDGLAGLVLVAGSPPRPEPMAESKRQEMLGFFAGDAARSRKEAHSYIGNNVGSPKLPEAEHDALAAEVLRAKRDAWVAWLEGGSKEDWSARIGTLRTPALVVAGEADEALGHEAQREATLPHLADAEMVVLPGAGHLLPVERPETVARLIAARFAPAPVLGEEYRDLVEGPRVSARTRSFLRERLAPPPPAPKLPPELRATLRAAIDRVLPQGGPARIDLANRLLGSLGGPGDGWRPVELPPDAAAWEAGLRTLDALGGHFAGQEAAVQDALLHRVAAEGGGLGGDGMLGNTAMRIWFEEMCAEATRQYMAHPSTWERMRYAGFAYGGDGPEKPGFRLLGRNEREAWEPV